MPWDCGKESLAQSKPTLASSVPILMKTRNLISLLAAGAALTAANLTAATGDWVELFDGKTLKGWTQRNGEAKYAVEDGAIVGRTVHNTRNSFLCTDKHYANFIFEVEYKVDPRMNSGVQIRSHSLKSYRNGQVHGYQVEIDPSDRAWSGGIYDEGRRGWLNPLKDNPAAQKAFKQNQWNHYRVEAIGDRIKTWVNGVPAADLHDALTPSGFIALQVHSIPKDKPEGMEIRWRNVRIKNLGAAKPLPLFDGLTLNGWVDGEGDPIKAGGWVADEGALHRKDKGGSIYTELEYGDFEFNLEWKIAEGGNSGIKYRVKKYDKALLGPEYQVLDDDKHPDGQKREGRRKSAALYDFFKCNDQKQLAAVGEWNKTKIVARGSTFEHWLNGKKVLAYDTTGEDWKREHALSKFNKIKDFNQNPWGRIMLQDHGDLVWYRNISIKPLPPLD